MIKYYKNIISILLIAALAFSTKNLPVSAAEKEQYGSLVVYTFSDKQTDANANSKIPSDAVDYGGHSYRLFDIRKSWNEDEKYCESLGGHLATITSKEENDFLYQYICSQNTQSAYLGALKSDGSWKWIDNEEFSYTNWVPGEPNNQDNSEPYGMFYSAYTDGTWNGGNGGVSPDSSPFICEWDSSAANASGGVKQSGSTLHVMKQDGHLYAKIDEMAKLFHYGSGRR